MKDQALDPALICIARNMEAGDQQYEAEGVCACGFARLAPDPDDDSKCFPGCEENKRGAAGEVARQYLVTVREKERQQMIRDIDRATGAELR